MSRYLSLKRWRTQPWHLVCAEWWQEEVEAGCCHLHVPAPPAGPTTGPRPRGATSRNLQSQGSSGSLGLGRALSLLCFQAPELWDVPSQVPTVQRQARRVHQRPQHDCPTQRRPMPCNWQRKLPRRVESHQGDSGRLQNIDTPRPLSTVARGSSKSGLRGKPCQRRACQLL